MAQMPTAATDSISLRRTDSKEKSYLDLTREKIDNLLDDEPVVEFSIDTGIEALNVYAFFQEIF